MRGALRARVDCSLADLAKKQDGSWVTVGGIVTECKKIRTKSGSQMMFATLDDVEGQVEMLVFKADQAESASVIAPDSIVVVRGRLDHKDRGETKLVVQEARALRTRRRRDRRRPGRSGGPSGSVRGRGRRRRARRRLVEELKAVLEHHKGEAEVHLAVSNGDGETKLSCSAARASACAPRAGCRASSITSRRRGAGCLASKNAWFSRASSVDSVMTAIREKTGECRQCRSFCDKMVEPRGCVEMRCRYLYSFVDMLTGSQYVGCMQDVFAAKVDLEAVLQPGASAG